MIEFFVEEVNGIHSDLSNTLPTSVFLGIQLFFYAVFIAILAFATWKFYQTLSKEDFIVLDLRRYNFYKHPVAKKFFAVLLYFIEYILIMPILVLLWFLALSIVLVLMSPDRGVSQILILSASMIIAIRALAYFNEEISKELAKLFPFIALSFFLLSPGAFEITSILNRIKELPVLLDSILLFLFVIVILEVVLRVFYTLYELASGEEEVK